MSCGGGISAFKPRYKRLVDNIYPDYPEDGLNNANMQKLLYYVMTSPEKWDRIGEYLASRINKDLSRKYPRYGFVIIGMEAMDQLLRGCQPQHLNLFAESYLKTVQRLLERPEPDMQVRGTQSFLQFAQKEQDVPAYHIRYDFFISKFCQMCHFETNSPTVTTNIRVSGLQGIGGVVRTIESKIIWAPNHMEKIIPSLLYNIQIGDYKKTGPDGGQAPDLVDENGRNPLLIAEDTFRKLLGRAGYTSIRVVIKPILNHLDVHQMWTPPDFAEHVFQMVMFSIQQQVNYIIVEMLMHHLEHHQEPDNIRVKVGIAKVLSTIFSSRAVDVNVGPSQLETINALLTHLRTSVERAQEDHDPNHQLYQEALLTALGAYSSSLPNFQMIEIMNFVLSRTPARAADSDPASAELQLMLLRALLAVAVKVEPVQFPATFPPQFLVPLLDKLRSPDPEVRLLVLDIFQNLIDRRNNLTKLKQPTVEPRSDLQVQKPNINKQDNKFFEKHGELIYRELVRVIQKSRIDVEYLEQLYVTVSLLLLECNSDENIRLQLDMIAQLQDLAAETRISDADKFCLHATAISVFCTLALVVRIHDIFDYKDKLVTARRRLAPHLLPPLEEDYSPDIDPEAHIEAALVDPEAVRAALREAGRYREHGSRVPVKLSSSSSNPEPSLYTDSCISVTSAEVDSGASTPGILRRSAVTTISFKEMKAASAPPSAKEREEAEAARRAMVERFQTASFGELCEMNAASRPAHTETLYQCITDIYCKADGRIEIEAKAENKPIYEEYFPEMFTY